MAFPGIGMGGQAGAAAGMSPEDLQAMQMMKFMSNAMESCPAKGVLAGGAGFALGGVFGLFMSSMRYDTAMGAGTQEISSLPVRQQIVKGFKEMGRASYSSAKNFGYIGAIFASTECAIEGLRAKNDLYNSAAAGCLTGGFLAKNAGPTAAAVGCGGFAAFSIAIDAYMRMPSNDVGTDPII